MLLRLAGLIVIFLLIAWHEVPPLRRDKLHGELVAFVVLMLMAFALSALQVMGVNLPNPLKIGQRLNAAILGLVGFSGPPGL
ncbi:MAG: hypothetical protein ACOYEP_08515 [Limnochordia bacterium]|jgi:hypothetical protein